MNTDHQKAPASDRIKFIGTFAIGAAAMLAVTAIPFRRYMKKRNPTTTHAQITITPNPMAVERTRKGAAHHG
jgi:hypothetical protein